MNYNFRGTYDSTQNYNKLDVVIYKKSISDPKRIFLCLTSYVSATSQEPNPNADTPYWGILNADSNFPEEVDFFLRNKNMSASDVADVGRYQDLYLKTNRTPAEDTEMNEIADRLKDKQVSPEDFNQLKSSIENMQLFLKSEVEGYIDQKKAEFDSAIGQFKDVGAYSPSKNYFTKNMAKFNGNVYIAKQDSLNKTPIGDDADAYWTLLSVKGDTGQAGISVNYKGDYNNSASYATGDGVSYFGNLFYAKQNTISNLPTDSNYWYLADKIYVGTAPPAGPQTDQIWLDTSGINPKFMYWNGTNWIDTNVGNSDKLGGQLPSYYATAQSVTDHVADKLNHVPYAVATGTANTYAATLSPAPTAYVDGMAVSVKINIDATAASTLNVNSLGATLLKKANGLDVTNLKANGVYTFRYNSTTGNFILQGEGGEYGTATVGDVLAPQTIGTDNGLVAGTLALTGTAADADVLIGKQYYNTDAKTKRNGTMPDNGSKTYTPGATAVPIDNGKHTSSQVAAVANLAAVNIKKDVTVGGVLGTFDPTPTFTSGEVIQITTTTSAVSSNSDTFVNMGTPIRPKYGGTFRIKYMCWVQSGASNAAAQLYNATTGTYFGTLRTVAGPSGVTYTEDLAVAAGHLIYVRMHTINTAGASIYDMQNFQFCTTEAGIFTTS